MKEINIRKELSDYEEIDSISQSQFEYDAPTISLYKIGSKLIMEEVAGDHRQAYLLTVSDQAKAEKDPAAFLKDCAGDWAANCDNVIMEQLYWGILKPADVESGEGDGNKEFSILRRRYFNNHRPFDLVADDNYDPLWFSSAEDAQTWIDKEDNGTYYLQHGEMDRPDYWIVPANLA